VLFYFKQQGDTMKINLLFITMFISVIIFAKLNFETGHVGLTRLNGEGCQCHGIEFTDSVHVWIEGPDSLFVSDTVEYKILMTGGPAVAGGFNIAVMYGAIDSVDSLSHRMFFSVDFPLELTHTMPNTFINDTVFWSFKYIAPDSMVVDTIYSVANSTNGDGIPFDDQWNFGANFRVVVMDNPVTVDDEISPVQFSLSQNYPNPFNPSTTIKFSIPFVETGHDPSLQLKVYDILGNEVATLVNEDKPVGSYGVEFDGSNLPSGIYFYQLRAGNFVETKKMILLK
jgi:hypothetical protein